MQSHNKRPRPKGSKPKSKQPFIGPLSRRQTFNNKYYASSFKPTFSNQVTSGYLGIEKNFLDTYFNGTISSAAALTGGMCELTNVGAPSVGCVSAPGRGDGPTQRLGKKILIKSWGIKGKITRVTASVAVAAIPASVECYLALVSDSQTNGAQCTSETIFTNPGQTVVSLGECSPLKNLKSGKRFKIIKSWRYSFAPVGGAVSGSNYVIPEHSALFEHYLSMNLEVNFGDPLDGTVATVANVVDNSLHVVAFCTAVGACQIEYNSRIRFTP